MKREKIGKEKFLVYWGMSGLSSRLMSRSARRLRRMRFASAIFSKRVSRMPRTLARATTSGIRLLIFGTSWARAIPRISPSSRMALSRNASSVLQTCQRMGAAESLPVISIRGGSDQSNVGQALNYIMLTMGKVTVEWIISHTNEAKLRFDGRSVRPWLRSPLLPHEGIREFQMESYG